MTDDIHKTQSELIENFNFFDNWLDKYQLIIDLGKKLPDFPESQKTETNKIRGCQSNVWMDYQYNAQDDKLYITAVSDSAIVNGLIYLLITIYSNHSPKQILNAQADFISAIGLDQHLSPTRKNGLYALLQAINNIALRHLIK